MFTKENGPFTVIGVIRGIPLHSEPLLHRLQVLVHLRQDKGLALVDMDLSTSQEICIC